MEQDQIMMTVASQEPQWAIVNLNGHNQKSGRLTNDPGWGMLRLDVPVDNNGNYRSELIGRDAIYNVEFVSEEIARAYAPKHLDIEPYNEPIVLREEHNRLIQNLRDEQNRLMSEINELKQRLTAVKALTPPSDGGEPKQEISEDEIPF